MSPPYLIPFFLAVLRYEAYSYPAGNHENVPPILKPFGSAVDNVENTVKNISKFKTLTSGFPDSGRTRAVLESQFKESLPIQLDNKYGSAQEFVAGFLHPKPLVDTTQEHEKYGNDAATSKNAANLIVGGFEGLSNILNAAAETPFVTFYQFGKKLTASLNTVGGKLVGL